VQEYTRPEDADSRDQPLQNAADIACGVVPRASSEVCDVHHVHPGG
jgi:hypothetical protein